MPSFNSKKQPVRKFNSQRLAIKVRKVKEITQVYPPQGSGLEGWSELSSTPHGELIDRAHQRMVEHYREGCQGSPIEGQKNEDGTQARRCLNPQCGGRWQGIADELIPREVSETMGITGDKNGHTHYLGDGCEKPHYGQGTATHTPSLADYGMLMLQVPGRNQPISLNELLVNSDSIRIGTDANGEAIYPSRYMTDRRTGQHKHDSVYLRAGAAAHGAATGMRRLVEAGETDLRKYFQIAKDAAHEHFGTKRKEIDPKDSHGEEYVGIMSGAPQEDPFHVVANGTLKNIRETLGDTALIGNDPMHVRLWEMARTPDFTQTFNIHHVINNQLNPMSHVVDAQNLSKLATSKHPGVRESFFAGYPQDIPDVGNMAEMGNVAKKDPFSAHWRSNRVHSLVHRLVRDHSERNNRSRVDSAPTWQADYNPQTDENFMEMIQGNPEVFKTEK